MIPAGKSHKTFDTAIIGGGILGLWAARHAIKRGETAVLIEKHQPGAGASGGFLGALMPHMPDSWNPKKQFQFDGLTSIAAAIRELEDETGLHCGYRRCGRIMPLPHEKLLPQVTRRIDGARENWVGQFEMHQHLVWEGMNDWINAEIANHGIQEDSLSARINPRAYVRALEAFVRPRMEVVECVAATAVKFSSDECRILLSTGDAISAGRIVVANGWEAYPLLLPYLREFNAGKPIGRGVKGQAVLLEYAHNDDLPIVYHDGSYIVPHADNRVAIGSTSVNDWQTGDAARPDSFNPEDMEFYHRAMDLFPALSSAPIIDRWAGVRPRNTLAGRGTSPWFGPVPDHPNLIALIGGFKITLGVAHLDFATNPFTM